MSETRDRLRDFIVAELLPPGFDGTLEDDDELFADGLVDSVGVVRLVLYIEESFRLEVPPEDVTLEAFGSVRCLVSYLDERAARSS